MDSLICSCILVLLGMIPLPMRRTYTVNYVWKSLLKLVEYSLPGTGLPGVKC